MFASIYIGWVLLEKNYYPNLFPCLKYKPWNCRTCFTTWLMLGLFIIEALLLSSWIYGIVGLIITILNGIALKIDELEKMGEL